MRISALLLAFSILLAPVASTAGTVAGVDRREFMKYPFAWAKRFSAGVTDLVLCPVEIPFNALNETNLAIHEDRNYGAAMMAGTVTGFGFMFIRAASGLVQMVTFPVQFRRELVEPDVFHLTWGRD